MRPGRRGQQARDKHGGDGENLTEKNYISRSILMIRFSLKIKMQKKQKIRNGNKSRVKEGTGLSGLRPYNRWAKFNSKTCMVYKEMWFLQVVLWLPHTNTHPYTYTASHTHTHTWWKERIMEAGEQIWGVIFLQARNECGKNVTFTSTKPNRITIKRVTPDLKKNIYPRQFLH